MGQPILVVGGTGMLGRPVVRRMVGEGVPVRAFVRDEARARSMLPAGVSYATGDLRDEESLARAMDGCRGVYVNLENAMADRRPAWDPDTDGCAAVLRVARRVGVERIARISALGVDRPGAERWWPARMKAETDAAWVASGVPAAVFRPTWFMESLALFVRGGRLSVFDMGDTRLRWVAGDDLGRQVCDAMTRETPTNGCFPVQGPERLTAREAGERFAAGWDRVGNVGTLPNWAFRLLRLTGPTMRSMWSLTRATCDVFAAEDAIAHETPFPKAVMRIEDYTRSMLATGDIPKK